MTDAPLPHPKAIMIAAPRSGAGKTTVTLGLLRALTRQGLRVHPFKCGPDYIDPAFHEAAVGRPSYNVDSWAMRMTTALDLLGSAAGADIVMFEALMGLFDGVATPGTFGNGASADVAAMTGAPVVLVLDVSGQSQTAAAVARGFYGFRTGVEIAGVILNRIGSPRHERLARLAFAEHDIPVLGALPRQTAIEMPERHLGLVQAREMADLDAKLEALADLIAAHVDLPALIAAASPLRFSGGGEAERALRKPPAQRIALAQDAAFSFVYPHVLRGWRAAGAEILPFSPLADEAPSPSADLVWLPGGYPELHAERLATNTHFLESVRAFAAAKPVHGECGGYMVLGEGLTDGQGARHRMLGLLGLETSFAKRKLHLGYRRATLLAPCPLGEEGGTVRGHEFHYASILAEPDAPLFALADADGAAVPQGSSRRGQATGSFLHYVDGDV